MSINRRNNLVNGAFINQYSKETNYSYPLINNDYSNMYNIDIERRMIAEKMKETNTLNFHCNVGIQRRKYLFPNRVNDSLQEENKADYSECFTHKLVKLSNNDRSLSRHHNSNFFSQTHTNRKSKQRKSELNKNYIIKEIKNNDSDSLNNNNTKPKFIIASIDEVKKQKVILPSILKDLTQRQMQNEKAEPTEKQKNTEDNKSTIMHTISREVSKLEKMYINHNTNKNSIIKWNSKYNSNSISKTKSIKKNPYYSLRDVKIKFELNNTEDNKRISLLVKQMKY